MTEPAPVPATTETVTCPECGTVAAVALNRRDSGDFCRNCDYPLFWVPSRIVLGDGLGAGDQALRRLPGTVGRATIASLTCPHCSEPNPVTAVTCVRCGLSLRPEEPPPPPPPPPPAPVPVYEPPVYEEEPESGPPWWLWVLVGLVVLAAVVVLAVLLFT